MRSLHRGPWWRRSLAVVAAVAMTGGALAVSAPAALAAPAAAVEATGSLDWGVKESFRNYLNLAFTKGSTVLDGGATANADGTFHFPAATVDASAQLLSFDGSVSFSGHEGQLAVKISDIRLDLARGSLVADVASKALAGEGTVMYDDVDLTTVGSGAVFVDGNITGNVLPTALTALGVPAFADFYKEGDVFDPVSFTATYVVPVVAPVVTASPISQSVESGATATFTASATGQESVQWQVAATGTADWADIVGATSSTLTVPAAAADDGNQYRAAFTNGGGTVYSEAAGLTVTDAEVPGVVWSPAVEVFAADGVTPLSGAVAEGTKIVAKGSGFDPEANVAPAGSRPPIAAGSPAGTYVVFGKFADQWRPSEGAPSAARVVGDQLWAMSQAALDAVPSAYQNVVRGQWVEVSADGSFTAELTVRKKVVSGAEVEWPEAGNFGVYTYAAGSTTNAAQEVFAPVNVGNTGVVWSPAVEVFAADGVTPLSGAVAEGTKIVAKGSGFDPEANVAPAGSRPPIAAGSPAGTYVVFGKFADQWRPSEGAPSAARVVGDQLWAMSQAALDAVPSAYQNVVRGQWVEVSADGSFTAELTVRKKVVSGAEVEWPEAGNFGVYTYAAGSTTNAAQEVFAPVNVGNTGSVAAPVLRVEPASGLKHGSTVVVSGSDYAPNRWIYVAEVAQGPGEAKRPEVYENAERVQTDADGNFGPLDFSVTTLFKEGGFNAVRDQLYISTFNSPLNTDNDERDHASDRSQDAFVALAWEDPSAPVVTEPEVPAAEPSLSIEPKNVEAGKNVTFKGANFAPGSTLAFDLDGGALQIGIPSTEVTGGLDWGVKESFRNYLKSGIANGDVIASDEVVLNADGSYHFPASSFNAASKIAAYSGTVSMTGHAGDLEVKLSNLRVDTVGKQLLADVTSKSLEGKLKDYPDVALVSIDTTDVTADAAGLTGKDLPTVLTAEGVPAFADFYPAKTVFDALSFDIQSVSSAVPLTVDDGGKFSVLWAVPRAQKPGNYTITATAAAPMQLMAVEAQGAQTASAELQITAPVGSSDGVDDAVGVDDADGAEAANKQCTNGAVVEGTLSWGVKDSFRNYITGNIAKGQIAFNGDKVARDALFTFTRGQGNIDPIKRTGNVAFEGEVSFQGHDYGSGPVLSVTMKNVVLVMDGNAGTLKADVVSRSLESAIAGAGPGTDIKYDSVVVATLDLSKSMQNRTATAYVGTDVSAILAPSGVAPFADFYSAGDALDPVSFALGCSEGEAGTLLPVGAVKPAGVAAGAGMLAKTGAVALDASVVGALMILLLGAGAIASNRLVRRRRD
ncbi:HtaA domain-containing protein [Arthrobacter sp.]|uniref:HtaA domain-containing protein n=1 Tax=Arthrobacter sp. TaxID=1667 RepID=UPI0026DFA7A9|nr:HtaA domain-containing protein [Arthrobacter sp.]MDO5754240.1 HtaA domain-containing protein [Arthrobacter sp.]